jgi:predicted permease
MDSVIRDVRYAVRVLLRDPGFTLLAVLALALGISAATAVFTVVDSVLLRPLPYRAPEQLVVALHGPDASAPVSPADYLDYRRDARSFEQLGAAQAWGATLTGGERPERIAGLRVSDNLFDLLGVPAALGRTFAPGEDQPGRDRVVVLGYGLWQRRFGGDPAIVGRSLQLDGEPYEVVGVMPASFRFAPFWQTRAEMWTPLTLAGRLHDRGGRSLRLFGRLAAGVNHAEAQAEMSAIAGRLATAHPQTNTDVTITVRPLLDKVVSGIRGTLLALLAMVAFVLLIACANVASALLARASGRQREVAVRAALGASRVRLARQMLVECLLLSAAGCVAGLALAYWGVHGLIAALPPASLPRQHDVAFDLRVFGAGAIAALAAGIAAGLVPALQLLRGGVAGILHDGSRGSTEGAGRARFRSALIAAEMTLALVLLVGAGLMARTMMKLGAVDPGFRTDGIAVATISLAGTPHAHPAARHAAFRQVRDRLAVMPGVVSVAAINHLPLAGDEWSLSYTVEGRPAPPPGEEWSAVYRIVLPGYFRTVGLPLVAGRDISEVDLADVAPVAVVNRAMADRRWPGETAIGRRIHLPGVSGERRAITIVGVAANARQSDWTGAPADEVYLSYPQRASEFGLGAMTFVLKTDGDAGQTATAIPRQILSVDSGITVSDQTTMADVVADELWRERLTASLSGLFASVALGLAAIGLYAVVAHAVTRRTREFGVRLALGATSGDVRRLALADGLRPVFVGAGAGVALAFGLTRFMRTLLFGVSALDPAAIAGAAALLVAVAFLAAWLPARRASRLDPVVALRVD